MQLRIAIDGACTNNGQVDCISSGAAFISIYSVYANELYFTDSYTKSTFEVGSTNQRGELLGLICALEEVIKQWLPAQIITDSEYLFNAMVKNWLVGWKNKDWITATGTPVKNKDLWLKIADMLEQCENKKVSLTFYHLKGHIISFGKVTGRNYLLSDITGKLLYTEARKKYDIDYMTKHEKIADAISLSIKNNGFKLPDTILREFAACNAVVDIVASNAVDKAYMLYHKNYEEDLQ